MKRAATLPPLPPSIPSQLGPVPVRVVEKLRKKGTRLLGYYDMNRREIFVSAKASPLMQWQILYHEWTHMVLMDAGLHNVLGEEQQEVLCDTVGTARAVELLAGL